MILITTQATCDAIEAAVFELATAIDSNDLNGIINKCMRSAESDSRFSQADVIRIYTEVNSWKCRKAHLLSMASRAKITA
jgi:hypothetical protein